MAAAASSEPREHFSISKFISRFRSKSKKASPERPRDTRPPLKQSPLPLVLPEHQATLSQLGWTTVTFPQPQHSSSSAAEETAPGPHPLQKAHKDLFSASQAFFNLPDEVKENWKHKLGSEEGWSKIPGEKEFITLRTLSYAPDVLKKSATRYWELMGNYLDMSLGRISTSLNLSDSEEEGLRRYVGTCKRLGVEEGDKTATMLRLFRYEGWEEKIVAEPHADLGLLSCVVGNVPGLEVWNGEQFVGIEKTYMAPCATLLAGRQLERLSNFKYPAGGHRVVSYGRPNGQPSPQNLESKEPPKYRFSIVFVLRAHEPVIVNTDVLTTDITGAFQNPVKGVTAGKWYAQIRGAHFNINTGHQERDEQRLKLQDRKQTEGGGGSG